RTCVRWRFPNASRLSVRGNPLSTRLPLLPARKRFRCMASARAGQATVVGRRAALASGGSSLGAAAGSDGEVVVRYEAVERRGGAAAGGRRLLLRGLGGGSRTVPHYAPATHGRARTLPRGAPPATPP